MPNTFMNSYIKYMQRVNICSVNPLFSRPMHLALASVLMFCSPSHVVITFALGQCAPSCWKRHCSSPNCFLTVGRSCSQGIFGTILYPWLCSEAKLCVTSLPWLGCNPTHGLRMLYFYFLSSPWSLLHNNWTSPLEVLEDPINGWFRCYLTSSNILVC